MSDAVVLGRTVPAPAVSVETQPFWEAAKEGRFLVPRCIPCDAPFWYPRARCPFCGSGETAWRESPGEGAIYSYSIMRRAADGPYCVAYVTLDEGVSMLTNIVDCAPGQVAIGARVKLKWVPTGNGPPVPAFALA